MGGHQHAGDILGDTRRTLDQNRIIEKWFPNSGFAGGISVTKVKHKITESKCRCGYFKKGQEFIVEDLCPPLCHELWNNIYPSVYALQNGASLDYRGGRAKTFVAACPDEGRVWIHGEVIN